MRDKSPSSTPIPLQILRPGQGGETGDGDRSNRELQIVDRISPNFASRSKLPGDWVVEKRPRKSYPDRIDSYYYEPGTGRQFRSLTAVHKYLSLTEDPGSKKRMQIMANTVRSTSSFKLPDGWIVEEKLRTNINYSSIIDKYYIEPGTGNRFRSLIAVERYLAEAGESTATPKALEWSNHLTKRNFSSKTRSLEIILKQPTDNKGIKTTPKSLEPGNNSTASKNAGSRNKNKCCNEVKDPMLDFASPPAKIKWVFSCPGGNAWSSYMSGSVVPESVQQKWSEAFVLSVQDRF